MLLKAGMRGSASRRRAAAAAVAAMVSFVFTTVLAVSDLHFDRIALDSAVAATATVGQRVPERASGAGVSLR